MVTRTQEMCGILCGFFYIQNLFMSDQGKVPPAGLVQLRSLQNAPAHKGNHNKHLQKLTADE